MKTKNWVLIISIISIGFFFACSGEAAEKKAKSKAADIEVLPGEDETPRLTDNFNKTAKVITQKNYTVYKKIAKKYKGISHFTVIKNGMLFLRQSKKDVYLENGKYDNRVRYGLVDQKGNELLTMTYEQISNPGFVVKDMVEFKDAGKYGLYNYVTNEIVNAKYDVIYPSKIMEYIAIGDIGGQLFKIYKDGSQKAFTEEENAPNYFNLLKDFKFNYASSFFAWWYGVDEFEYMDQSQDYSIEQGTVIPPSYLGQLKLYPNIMMGLFTGEDSLNLEPIKQIQRNDNIMAFTTDLFKIVAESRGYTENSVHLTTVNKKNRVQSSVELYTADEYSFFDANDAAKPSLKFLNDSIVEVKNFKYVENTDDYNPYTYRTVYEYYSIGADGKIKSMGEGNYPMISAIALSRTQFKGCFIHYLTDQEKDQEGLNTEENEYNTMLHCTDHLSANDIEFMMNELYARKGMKFSDPVLIDYFSKFTWYKPKYKSVESKLSDIEKTNIAMIKRFLKDVKSNPSKFIHQKTDVANEAG